MSEEEQVNFNDKCPECNSATGLSYGSIEPVDESIKQPVECGDCGHEFVIWSLPQWYYYKNES